MSVGRFTVPAMDVTVTTAELASAAAELVRLVPGRLTDPVLSGLLLTATANGLVLAGTDRERSAMLDADALVHTAGRVLVPAKPLAETLRALELPQVRLVVEGARLAIRAPGARFALPLLDVDVHPGVPAVPAPAGQVDAGAFGRALATVASTASRDDALPVFTGVRMRTEADQLVLLATDRYRMAVGSLPWRSLGGSVDALVPASLLTEIARQIGRTEPVSVHAGQDRMALRWGTTTVTTAVLDGSFLHESKVELSAVDTELEVDADTLAGAVRRVGLYTDARGVLSVEVGDGEVWLRGADQQSGEAEEAVKATVTGGRTPQAYQSRFLTDALRPFSGGRVSIAIQPGMRATVFRATEPTEVDLRYVVMPMLQPR